MNHFLYHFPICFVSGELICTYKSGKFYLVNIETGSISNLTSAKISLTEKFLSRVKILSRMLRLGVRYGILLNENELLYIHNKAIFKLNTKSKIIIKEKIIERGNRPLSMVRIQNFENFSNGVYFGEYFSNPDKLKVHIYKRENNGKWNVIGSFPDGAINHIHALIPDSFQKCVWILTGDFDNAAGIWNTRDEFQTVTPVLVGEQKYRACVAFPTEKGLLYATDTPFSNNSIRLLYNSNSKWISENIIDLNGPVIYGCEFRSSFVFSTSVEGNGDANGLANYLGRKRGMGIKEPKSYIYLGNLETGFKSIYCNEKDLLPFVLFQFGVILFPEGRNETSVLPFYPIALKKNDLALQLLRINI